jgi:uridine kinase
MQTAQLIETICKNILSIQSNRPILVGVDGVGAAGKTVLADSLIEPLEKSGKSVIRSSVDNFHNPEHIRKQKGNLCPIGYFEDSFDYEALIKRLLAPLSEGGSLEYQAAKYDFRNESSVSSPYQKAKENSVLVFEGVFLFRPEIIDFWDFKILVKSDFDITLKRALKRDLSLFGTEAIIREKYHHRYIPGQQHYLDICKPELHSDMVINNNDFSNPIVESVSNKLNPEQPSSNPNLISISYGAN